jgi:hypothetical protein
MWRCNRRTGVDLELRKLRRADTSRAMRSLAGFAPRFAPQPGSLLDSLQRDHAVLGTAPCAVRSVTESPR